MRRCCLRFFSRWYAPRNFWPAGRHAAFPQPPARDETGALQSLLAGISAAGASIVTINQSTPENGAALVAVTIRTDTMQMTPEELTEKLSRQRMVVGVHCGYNL